MEQVVLFQHQQKALEETKHLNHVAYYLDMGLGKTFVGSEKAVSFPEKILVVCQHSKVQDWIEHFQKFYPLTVFDLTIGTQREEYWATLGKCVGVVNYELIFRRQPFKTMRNFTLMLDESSLIQNETAKRSKFILNMNPTNVILLSGTPTDGRYERLWSQLHLLGWQITKKTFWQHYVQQEWFEDDQGFKHPVITGYKNVDRLKSKMAAYGCIFMKSDEAFTLPEQVEMNLMIPSSTEYRKFMRKRLITINLFSLKEWKDDSDFQGKDVTPRVELVGDTSLTMRLYARQLCGAYSKAKLQAFEDLIQSTSDRLIVFYNFTKELIELEAICNDLKRPFSLVNGQCKDLTNYENCDDSITFIQYQAGAMGLNLQKSNKIVYFTLPEKSEFLEQSKKRIHRIGQKNTCFYYYLLCRGSVELDILENLKMRKDYTDELFKKKHQPDDQEG